MFDGVHLGHQAVLRQAMESAQGEEGHISGVLTFDPHPSQILYPERATSLIMPVEQRIEHVHMTGVDCSFVQPFTDQYARQKAEDFLPALTTIFPALKSIHIGENFRFGAGRSGNVDTLRKSAAPLGVEVFALERRILHGVTISSSRIRAALIEGAIDEVNAMLGQPYTAIGRIKPGKGLGRKIEFPTLNLQWSPEVNPRFGVYRVYLKAEGSDQPLMGVANYGLRPTVGDSTEPLLEIHLLETGDRPSAGDVVKVALIDYLRPEKEFPSMESLREQIAMDVRSAHEAFDREGAPDGLLF